MKYGRIIYNSSQKNRSGNVGFGVRTMTEGMEESFLNVIEERELFTYDSGKFPPITPKELFENPSLILNMPVGYLYTKINVTAQQPIYLLAKKTSVGFDYTYYVNNQAGRLGNYVVDCYVFNEPPTVEVFQLLYETPAPGSNSFLPKTPIPSPDNEEMKRISLGQQAPLPVTEYPFAALSLPPIHADAIEILFAYLESRKIKKPLVISLPSKRAGSIMADFYRLLPPELAAEVTFCTNHQEDGLKRGFEIFCINEYYQFEIYPSQVLFLDLMGGGTVSSLEKEMFKDTIVRGLNSGNLCAVYDILRWIPSVGYEMAKGKSSQTNEAFFYYCIKPDLFTFDFLNPNKELLQLLSAYIASNDKNGFVLNELTEKQFRGIKSVRELQIAIQAVAVLESAGIRMECVIHKVNVSVSNLILQSPASLASAIADCSLNQLKRYFVKKQFEDCLAYLEEEVLKKYWVDLYPYFYQNPKAQAAEIALHLFRLRLPSTTCVQVLTQLKPVDSERLDFLVSLLKSTPELFSDYWPLIEILWEKEKQKDLAKDFASQIANPAFAPLFYFDVNKRLRVADPVGMLKNLERQMELNKSIKELVVSGFRSDNIYGRLFNALKSKVTKANYEVLQEEIEKYVFNVLRPCHCDLTDWTLLQDLMAGVTEDLDNRSLMKAAKLAKEVNDKNYFEKLIPRLAKQYKTESEIADFVKDVFVYSSCEAKGLYELIAQEPVQVKLVYYRCVFSEKKYSFDKVMLKMDEFTGISIRDKELFYTKNYAKEFAAFQRKQGFKSFISSITTLFKRDKKGDAVKEKRSKQ